jgi:hypothetical protein
MATKLRIIFATVIVMAAFVAINAWAAGRDAETARGNQASCKLVGVDKSRANPGLVVRVTSGLGVHRPIAGVMTRLVTPSRVYRLATLYNA